MISVSDDAIRRLRELMERPGLDAPGSRYEVRERIGEGGMGVVYLAFDRHLQREVALKVLRSAASSAEERARILREARILAALEHPGIVPIHDVGTLPDGRMFYVMKHVRGEPLHRVASRQPAPPRHELLRMFRQVCEAVAFAHAAGVIHRDLKPHNVMVGAFGEVLVLDWGVARLRSGAVQPSSVTPPPAGSSPLGDSMDVEDGRDITATGAVMGTPGYMAPEQAAGLAAHADERADVYGLGGILHFLLTGAHPSDGVVDAPLPRALRAILARARAVEPADRYQSAQELAADVANYMEGLSVAAHREGVLERARRLAHRHRTALLLVAGYLIMRLALLVFGGR